MSSEIINKTPLNVGTIGHVDHGKTTLTAALTMIASKKYGGTFRDYEAIDKAPEERKRGITINASTVEYQTENRRCQHTDCPGHADYIKNAITGSADIDVAVLVVSASDGVMPQTKEHLCILKCMGRNDKKVIVYINKVDIVDEDIIECVEAEILDLLESSGYDVDNLTIIKGSALCALEDREDKIGKESIYALLDALNSIVIENRDENSIFLLPIQGVNHIEGRGTVVTGIVEGGSLNAQEEVEVIGFGNSRKTVCTSIQSFYKSLPKTVAGENVALLLRGIKRDEVERGQVVCRPGTVKTYSSFEAQIYLLKHSEGGRQKPIFSNYRPQFFIRTADVTGVIVLPEGVEMAMPGDTIKMKINLISDLPLVDGLRFTVREGGDTVARGFITAVF